MCGIFGVVQNGRIEPQHLSSVSRVLAHRGPDDEGFLFINVQTGKCASYQSLTSISEGESNFNSYNAAFLHRRLSIIDVSKSGHQPMSYADDRFWITYNGEIYNYLELRDELKLLGFRFQTNSDTEVILASFLQWGKKCVEKFNGIWAFAIYDSAEKSFFLSRDRLGVKPLYYYFGDGIFIFASEVKAIQSYLTKKINLNLKKVERFLRIGQLFVEEDDETFFIGVKSLKSATNLIYFRDNISIERYWVLNINRNDLTRQMNISRFRELFYSAIKLQFRSDVEIGSCLSGGLDSSSVVAVASNLFSNKLNTFSAIWPSTEIDESVFINAVNSMYGCASHTFEPDMSNMTSLIDKVIWHQEIPLSGSSLLAQWRVFEMVNQGGVKVVLDGEGSDEILAGYPKYIITYLNELLNRFKIHEIIKNYGSLKSAGYSIKPLLRVFHRSWRNPKSNPNYTDLPYQYELLATFLADDIQSFILPTLLHQKDKTSMAHSVEARVPFLDHELVEFALTIPAEQKINGGVTKVILRESLKGELPKIVYNRRDKIGFATPVEERYFSSTHNKEWTNEISEAISIVEKYFDTSEINIDKVFGQRKNFCLYALSRFIKKWG